jgi:hypothetical protein
MKRLFLFVFAMSAFALNGQVQLVDTIATDNEKYILIQTILVDNKDTLYVKPEVEYADPEFIKRQKIKKEKERQDYLKANAPKPVYAKPDEDKSHRYGINFFVISAQLACPFITSKKLDKDSWKYQKSVMLDFALQYKLQFISNSVFDGKKITDVRPVSLAVGLGFTYLTKSTSLKLDKETLESQTDDVGDTFIPICYYNNISEQIKLCYLNIPIDLEFGKSNLKKVSFWGRIGLMPSVRVSSKFVTDGSFTTTGGYSKIDGEDVNVLIRDIPELNFYTNKPVEELDKKNNTKMNPFVLWMRAAAGVHIPLTPESKNPKTPCMLKIGVNLNYSLIPVAKKSDENFFEGGQFNFKTINMLSGKGNGVLTLGMEIGFIMVLKHTKTVK